MNSSRKILRALVLAGLFVFASGFRGCYKPVTKSGLPAHVRTVAVPAFQNQALRYKVESRFTEAVMNEIIRRGKGLTVCSESKGVEACVKGTMRSAKCYALRH